jgi:hypothetical protein
MESHNSILLIKTAVISRMVKQSRRKQRQSRKQRKSQRQSRRSQRGGAAPFDAPYEALAGAARAAAQVAPLDRYISDLPGLIPKQGGGHYRQRGGEPDPSGNNVMMMNMNSPDSVWAGGAQGGGRYRQRNGSGNAPRPGFVNVSLTNAPAPSAPVKPSNNAVRVGNNVLVGGSAPFGDPYTYKLNGGRRYRRKNKKSRRQRSQRGGNAPFDAPYSLGFKLPGVNEQFASEGSVNSLYSQNRGAQGY